MRKAVASDKPHVVDTLARAFDLNKSVNFVAKQDARRLRRIRKLMEYSFDVCFTFGEIWTSDDQQACALVLYPENRKTTLRSIIWDLKLALFVIGIERVSAVLKREAMIKANHPKEPIAYLWFLGVNPDCQGKRLGSALMLEVIAEYDRRGRPIFLETSMEKNLPFYEKLGFEIFNTVELTYRLYIIRRLLNVPRQ